MDGRWYGRLGLAGVSGFILLLGLLHVLEPGFSVVDDYTSDYALGDAGWLMRVAFASAALGVAGVALGLRAVLLPGRRVVLAWRLLLVSAAGFVLVSIFDTDPTAATEMTTHGTVHVAAAAVIFLCLLIACWVLRGVFARDPAWRGFAGAQRWWAIAYSATFVDSFFLPTPAGIGQRLFVAVLMAWLFTVAWRLQGVGVDEPGPDDGSAVRPATETPGGNRSQAFPGQS
jgi:hypothetical membrane protein